jgi:hypothetical protein
LDSLPTSKPKKLFFQHHISQASPYHTALAKFSVVRLSLLILFFIYFFHRAGSGKVGIQTEARKGDAGVPEKAEA